MNLFMFSKLIFKPFLLSSTILSVLFFSSSSNASNVIIPSEEISSYCKLVGCDNQIFYKYHKKKSEWFCKERNYILGNEKASSTFLYLLKEVKRSGLPLTSSILPIIESSLNPNAVANNSTRKNAAKGLWQLVPSTARDMGLVVKGDVDQRLDVELSTKAGIKYIKMLEKRYDGDHNLAILAYHSGLGRVERTMKRYNTRNPWFISKLFSDASPDENYLLKYYSYSLALMNKGCVYEN